MKVDKIWIRENVLVPQLRLGDDKETRHKASKLRKELLELLTAKRFVSFAKQPNLYFDNKLNCLWLLYGFQSQPSEMFRNVAKLQIHVFRRWELPSVDELRSIALEPLLTNHRKFQGATIYSGAAAKEGKGYWTVEVGEGNSAPSEQTHTILPIHRVAQRDILSFVAAHALLPKDAPEVEEKLQELYALMKTAQQKNREETPPSLKAIQQHLLEGDYVRAHLPVLEPVYLTDIEKGLWELFHPEKPGGGGWVEVQLDEPWEARTPELDLRKGVVAIDFGTSSTVVACREQGKTTLLRVGIGDFFKRPAPEDYQNPTVLAFVNLPNLLRDWNSEAHRPPTRWEDFRFSHEALAMHRENHAEQRIVSSILTGIKQWPLRSQSGPRPRITDQSTTFELELAPPNTPMPVPGQPLTVSEDDPFDPIELYAYYLGLFINHRAVGIYLDYYMTFPVTYPKQVKQRILASFARGLQRSLPAAVEGLPAMERFSVREEASEPAAYAACALGDLEIEATRTGTAYGVFDFGGGSTDFDYGVYRLPGDRESRQGFERVIEHFGASGDMYLGGENLVAHLVYHTFVDNLETCRRHRVPFVCPPEAERFPGHELFIDNSHVAQTNHALMMEVVRPIWEELMWLLPESAPQEGGKRRRLSDRLGDALSRLIISTDFDLDPAAVTASDEERHLEAHVELLNRDWERVPVVLRIDRNALNRFLAQRVGKGVMRFFMAMKQAFDARNLRPDAIHILQAGNACRSLVVQGMFAAVLQDRMIGWEPPVEGLEPNPVMDEIRSLTPYARFVVHRPPAGDPENPYRPTAKTGVAIGLLRLIPGETLLALGPAQNSDEGEAPFRFFVGGFRQGHFQPTLMQNGVYHQWRELGIPTRGVFVLAYSTSPQAGVGGLKRGASELQEHNLSFGPGNEGKRVYAQAVGPGHVEVALADSEDQIIRRPEEILFREILDLQ
ncbi:MAG: hypothetical protein HQL51_04335 [Magnetococcales bacterium]|nr:hypothetical protein [Magnetococcales bacterium]